MDAPPPPDGAAPASTVRSEATTALAYQVAALAAGALTNIVIARTLGPDGKGILSLLSYAIFIATSLGGVGTQPAAVHLIGKGRFARGQLAAAVSVVSLVTGIACAAATLVLLPRFRGTIPLTPVMVAGTAILVVPSLLRLNLGGLLLAVGRIRAFNLVQTIPSVLWMAGSFVLLVGFRGGTNAAVDLWVVIYAVSGVLAAIWILLLVPPRADALGPALRACLTFGIPAYIANLLWILVLRVDGFILAAHRPAAEVGIYSVAVILAEIVLYIPRSMTLALYRRLAAGEKPTAARLAARAARNGGSLAFLAAPPLAGASAVLIPLVFGDRFAGSFLPLVWLLPGIVAMSIALPLSLYLVQQRGKPAWTGSAALVGLAVDVGLCLLWIPGHGAVGAAWASSAAYAAHAATVALLFRRETGCAWREILVPDAGDVRGWRDLVGRTIRRGTRGGP